MVTSFNLFWHELRGRGHLLSNGVEAALRLLQRACGRESSRLNSREHIVAAGELLMTEARPRRVQGDAETLNYRIGGSDHGGAAITAPAAVGGWPHIA